MNKKPNHKLEDKKGVANPMPSVDKSAVCRNGSNFEQMSGSSQEGENEICDNWTKLDNTIEPKLPKKQEIGEVPYGYAYPELENNIQGVSTPIGRLNPESPKEQKYAPKNLDAMRETKCSRSDVGTIAEPVNVSEKQTAPADTNNHSQDYNERINSSEKAPCLDGANNYMPETDSISTKTFESVKCNSGTASADNLIDKGIIEEANLIYNDITKAGIKGIKDKLTEENDIIIRIGEKETIKKIKEEIEKWEAPLSATPYTKECFNKDKQKVLTKISEVDGK